MSAKGFVKSTTLVKLELDRDSYNLGQEFSPSRSTAEIDDREERYLRKPNEREILFYSLLLGRLV